MARLLKRVMATNILFICIVLLISILIITAYNTQTISPDKSLTQGTQSKELRVAGRRWTYKVHVPPQYQPGQPIPLVLILHGAGGDGELYLDVTGWRRKANQAGFIAVAPDGLPSRPLLRAEPRINPRVWNAGNLRKYGNRVKIDDVAFFRELLNKVRQDYTIDNKSIYLTGHSNGGAMAFILATQLTDFAAIAPVMALYWLPDKPRLAAPVSTLYIVGTKDPVIPLEGGASKLSIWGSRNTKPVQETISLWADASGCPLEPLNGYAQKYMEITEYKPCANNTEFTVYFVKGQGHNWPGGTTNLRESIIGPDLKTLNATDVIWDFFKRHTR